MSGRGHAAVRVMDSERVTRVGGLEALWRPTHDLSRRIEVVAVHDKTGECSVVVWFAPKTDLAEARVQRPQWELLWDRVRREFWSEMATPPTYSTARNRAIR